MSAFFITLTYSTDYVPIQSSGYMTLDKADVQKFMKRLRKRMSADVKLKYYCCGEYGSRNWRPHYHMLLFNFPLVGQELHDYIVDVWKLGEVHIGSVTPQSVDYTLKYMCKPSRVPLHRNDTRVPEFSLMSKGLGLSYLTDEVIEWHNADIERAYIVRPGGVKIAIPRYYKSRIFPDDLRARQAAVFHDKARDDEFERQMQFQVEHGSLDNYQVDKYARLMQARDAYFKRSNQNRKTL